MTDAHNTAQRQASAYRQARQFRLPLLPLPCQGRHLALLKFPPVGRLGELLFFGLHTAAGSASVGSRESVVYRVPTDHAPAAACSARPAAPAGRWLFATRAALFAPAQPQGGDREKERTTHVRRERWQRQCDGQVAGKYARSRSRVHYLPLRRVCELLEAQRLGGALLRRLLRDLLELLPPLRLRLLRLEGNSGRGCNEGRTRHT